METRKKQRRPMLARINVPFYKRSFIHRSRRVVELPGLDGPVKVVLEPRYYDAKHLELPVSSYGADAVICRFKDNGKLRCVAFAPDKVELIEV